MKILEWKTLRAAGLAAAIALAGAGALRAQEDGGEQKPEDLFKSAREAYDAKKYGAALKDVQALQSAIAKMRAEQLKALMPKAPDGWESDEPTAEVQSAMVLGLGVTVKREYRKGDSSVGAELVSDSPIIASFAAMMTNPMLIQGNPNLSLTTIQGKKALVETNKESRSVKATILLAGNTSMLTLNGSNVERKDVTETVCKQFKLDEMEKALQN